MAVPRWSVEVWWGAELGIPDRWLWWWDYLNQSAALTEQQRMEYYHGHPARVVARPDAKRAAST